MYEPRALPTKLGAAPAKRREDGVGLWTVVLAGGLMVGAVLFIAVAYMTGLPGFRSTQAAAAVAGGSAPEHLYLTIVTNEGVGPAFVPSSFSIPSNTQVTITVTDFDGNTPLPAALASHARVSGTLGGTALVQPLNASQPVLSFASARSIRELPAAAVSHTFTIPSLGLNVPLEGMSKTTFTVLVKRAGSYRWQCFDPCGSGSTGFGGAMAEPGYMSGTLSVTA